jgi:hypothetical protein
VLQNGANESGLNGAHDGRAEASVEWWLGDWWAYGEAEYGERIEAVWRIE